MLQLAPPVPHGEVTALEALADPPRANGRPAVRICMVQTIDGVAAIDGRSGPLGGEADRAFFLACRALADVVLVGAQTVRAERYGPAKLTPQLVVARQDRGQPPVPPIAVVSASLDLDPTAPFFTAARARPIILTCHAAPAARRTALAGVADVLIAGDETVDMATAVQLLGRDGCRLIGCEGGPRINAALLAAGLVDELCLSIAPFLAGDGPRIATPPVPATPLAVHKCFLAEGALFVRLRPRPDGPS